MKMLIPKWTKLTALVSLLSACSSVNIQSDRFLGSPSYPPTNAEAVQILQAEPTRPHVALGEIIIEPYGNPVMEKLEAKVRSAAAKLGADAVVVKYDGTRLTGWTYWGSLWAPQAYTQYGRVIVVVAIRYTEG